MANRFILVFALLINGYTALINRIFDAFVCQDYRELESDNDVAMLILCLGCAISAGSPLQKFHIGEEKFAISSIRVHSQVLEKGRSND